MRNYSTDFSDHLKSGTTTLCWCWRVERKDGTVLGFTDLDRSLSFLGMSFEPQSGMTASAYEQNLQMAVDNLDIQGALTSDSITAEDVANGLGLITKMLECFIFGLGTKLEI
jgi:hypothetical protein